MSQKAIVFDVDGTLIDSVDLHARAWQEAFTEVGKQIIYGDLRTQIGKGADLLVPHFISQEEVERLGKKIAKRQEEIFKKQYSSRVRPFSCVPELFRSLQKEAWKVVLASSGRRQEVDRHKKLLQIESLTDLEVSSDEVERSKPHPDIFELVLRKLNGLDPSRVLAVGDTPYDVKAASGAQIRTVALLCGGFPEKALMAAGAVAVFRSPAELLFRYEDWCHFVRAN